MSANSLNIGIFAGGLSWPLYAAQDRGIFAAHDLDVSLHAVSDSVQQVQSLQDGSYDVIMTPFDNVVAYQEGQGEVSLSPSPEMFAFMGGLNGCLRLLGGLNYKTVEALKGSAIGVDAEHTGYTLAMYELLQRAGLPLGSYQLVETGGTTFRVKALEAGTIAATMVSSPQEIGPESKGFTRLGDVYSTLGEYQAVCGVSKRSWAGTHAEILHRFIAAYVEANDWLREPANASEAGSVFVKYIDGGTEEQARRALKLMTGDEGFQPQAAFSPAGAKTVLAIRRQYGVPTRPLGDWTAYVDENFYREALHAHKR